MMTIDLFDYISTNLQTIVPLFVLLAVVTQQRHLTAIILSTPSQQASVKAPSPAAASCYTLSLRATKLVQPPRPYHLHAYEA
jgi:hypothetical protein